MLEAEAGVVELMQRHQDLVEMVGGELVSLERLLLQLAERQILAGVAAEVALTE
jgi:hypothetical protein